MIFDLFILRVLFHRKLRTLEQRNNLQRVTRWEIEEKKNMSNKETYQTKKRKNNQKINKKTNSKQRNKYQTKKQISNTETLQGWWRWEFENTWKHLTARKPWRRKAKRRRKMRMISAANITFVPTCTEGMIFNLLHYSTFLKKSSFSRRLIAESKRTYPWRSITSLILFLSSSSHWLHLKWNRGKVQLLIFPELIV